MPWTKNYFFPNLNSKPYALLGITGFLIAVISFLPVKEDTLDMPLHDTYIVFTNVSFFRIFAVILLFLWSLYLAANRLMLSYRLTQLHVIATLSAILLFLILDSHTWGLSGAPRRYYAMDDFNDRGHFFNIALIYIVDILTLLIGQILFAINWGIGIIRFFRQVRPASKNRL